MKKATSKTAPVKKIKKSPKKAIEDVLEAVQEDGEETGGKIAQILLLWAKNYTRKDIVKAGFNRSTVYRQVAEFEKMKKAPVMSYFGHDMYEGRIQRVMATKKMSRDAAVKFIASKDIESD